MQITFLMLLVALPILLGVLAAVIYLFRLLVRALRKYLSSGPIREEAQKVRRTLGENIKAHRTALHMTQEFVAESLGVSRQAVSKWESGASDPSTANLLALAKLFGISAEELLRGVE